MFRQRRHFPHSFAAALPYSCLPPPLYGEHNRLPAGSITSPCRGYGLQEMSPESSSTRSRVKNAKCFSIFWESTGEEESFHCLEFKRPPLWQTGLHSPLLFLFSYSNANKKLSPFLLKGVRRNLTSDFTIGMTELLRRQPVTAYLMHRVIPLSSKLPREPFLCP